MKTFKNYIIEVFDTKVDFNIKTTPEETIYTYKDETIGRLVIEIIKDIYSPSRTVKDFLIKNKIDKKTAIQFTLNHSFNLTKNNENQFKILSIVYQAMQDYMSKINVKAFSFTSGLKEPSRIKFYDKIAPLLAKKFGFEFESITMDDDNYKYKEYILWKKL